MDWSMVTAIAPGNVGHQKHYCNFRDGRGPFRSGSAADDAHFFLAGEASGRMLAT
jgi:hypothetical protein